MVTFRPISVAETRQQMPLLQRTHDEVGMFADMPLEPQWAFYEQAEQLGALLAVGAFDSETMVGFVVMLVAPSPHTGVRIASSDIVYLAPEARRGTTGSEMLDAARRASREAGAAKLAWRAQPGTTLQRLVERHGELAELVYLEVLHGRS